MRESVAMSQPIEPPQNEIKNGPTARRMALGIPLVLGMLVSAGCSQHALEKGWADPCKVQVQFYTPEGATVAVKDLFETRRHQVAYYGSDHRLEHTPEEFSVFNLSTGCTYPFKYTTMEGYPGVSIYGDLEVWRPSSKEARQFVEHTFVPIALLAQTDEPAPPSFHPTIGPSGVGLDALEWEHLKQGDLITKVYFVADLQKAWETIRMIDDHIRKLRSAETVINTHLEFVDTRFEDYRQESLYSDPTIDPLVAQQDWTGYNKTFIRLEAQRQELENKRTDIREQIDDLQNEKRIRVRLLDSMRILNRRGSLVLATPENQWEFHNTVDQIAKERHYRGFEAGPSEDYETDDIELPALGEVIVVMRVGGRHKHWDDPRREMVALRDE